MDWVGLVMSLVTGGVGGNLAGMLLKNLSLGTLGNTIAGVAGGGLGGTILDLLGIGGGGEAASSMDLTNIISSVASGGVGGGVLMAVVGAIKKAMSKS